MNILCYGDSNTFGWDPRSFFGGRYDEPWPEHLSKHSGFQVRTDAACGREIPKRPVEFPNETDLLILMLGTNDLLRGSAASEAAERMAQFLSKIHVREVLLLAPPPLCRGEWVPDEELISRSRQLALEYRALAQKRNIRFLDTGGWGIPLAFDGVHFTEDGHRLFAEHLRKELTHA